MSKITLFFINLLLATVRLFWLILISAALLIIGAIWSDTVFMIGLAVAITNVIVAIVYAFYLLHVADYRSEDDPEFNEMMDKLRADPKAFLQEVVGANEANKALHGEALLQLGDEELCETVYLQNLDIAAEAEDAQQELAQFSGARRTVYILEMFDAEVQNGGLCQFFVNSTRTMAPYVSRALEDVGAQTHKDLFDGFIAQNNIDVSDLESFQIFKARDFKKQAKRYDFDAFDEAYYALPALQDFVIAYIKSHITEF